MAKHTPGPWHQDRWGEIAGPDGRPVAFAAASRMTTDDVAGSNGVASANARLIAAAPDLLRILRVMAKHHSSSPWIGEARAAIAKATGEEG